MKSAAMLLAICLAIGLTCCGGSGSDPACVRLLDAELEWVAEACAPGFDCCACECSSQGLRVDVQDPCICTDAKAVYDWAAEAGSFDQGLCRDSLQDPSFRLDHVAGELQNCS